MPSSNTPSDLKAVIVRALDAAKRSDKNSNGRSPFTFTVLEIAIELPSGSTRFMGTDFGRDPARRGLRSALASSSCGEPSNEAYAECRAN
jgi:hypothetical protein